MALRIRLARGGAKKRPFYRIVVADSQAPRDGRFIERLGHWNPLLPKDREDRVVLQEERIKYWLEQGARPTDRVARFLGQAGLIEREARNNPIKGRLRAKAQERQEAAQAKAAEAAETPSETSAQEASAKEAPVEEAKPDETAEV